MWCPRSVSAIDLAALDRLAVKSVLTTSMKVARLEHRCIRPDPRAYSARVPAFLLLGPRPSAAVPALLFLVVSLRLAEKLFHLLIREPDTVEVDVVVALSDG